MVRLDLLDVGLVEDTDAILLVMRSPALRRLLVIETGLLEGQAVAMEHGGMRAERPLTQDLLHEVIVRLGASIHEARIHDFHDETYFAKLVLARVDGSVDMVEIDCRPSDAIALALRAHAPIYVEDQLMARFGIPEDPQGRFAQLFEAQGAHERIIH